MWLQNVMGERFTLTWRKFCNCSKTNGIIGQPGNLRACLSTDQTAGLRDLPELNETDTAKNSQSTYGSVLPKARTRFVSQQVGQDRQIADESPNGCAAVPWHVPSMPNLAQVS